MTRPSSHCGRCPTTSPAVVAAAAKRLPARPVDLPVRRQFEGLLKHDFGRVRVHADEQAAALARDVGARAFAVGDDIVFSEQAYAPSTERGWELLAHELVHVAQQRTFGATGALKHASDPADAAEREARDLAGERDAG